MAKIYLLKNHNVYVTLVDNEGKFFENAETYEFNTRDSEGWIYFYFNAKFFHLHPKKKKKKKPSTISCYGHSISSRPIRIIIEAPKRILYQIIIPK